MTLGVTVCGKCLFVWPFSYQPSNQPANEIISSQPRDVPLNAYPTPVAQPLSCMHDGWNELDVDTNWTEQAVLTYLGLKEKEAVNLIGSTRE